MARIRTIKPQFFTSEDVTALAPLARLLFVGLFTECDRDGRVEDRPKTLKMRLLPGDECDVDSLLWSLVDGGLIRRYEAGGVRTIQVLAFDKHQRPHPKEPKSVLPKDGTDTRKPCLNISDREKVVSLPVETPSSPVGMDKEYGVSGREGVAAAAAPLITSALEFARKQERCAFVGSKIEVPAGLHADLRKSHGGPDPEKELRDWYLALNTEADKGQWRIPVGKDFFPWFKELYAKQFPIAGVNGTASVAAAIDAWGRE